MDRTRGIRQLQKELKDGGIYNLAEQKPLKVMSTGIATLDAALGTGGWVRGSQDILYGPPSSGKSAIAYTSIAAMQQRDPESMACIIDVERSANKDWLEKFGIDLDRVFIVQEPTIEECVNAFQQCMRANAFDIIVVDSLGAVIRGVDLDGKDGNGGDANTQQVGGSSRVITQWVNKANGELTKLDKEETLGAEVVKPVVMYINQVRDVIGARFPIQAMPGGNALHHMMGVIVKVSASNATAERMMGTVPGAAEKVQVGTRVTCTIEKNKFAPPRRQGGYKFCYQECPEFGFGIDNYDACYSLAVERGVIESRGAWSFFGTEGEPGFRKENGKDRFIQSMREDESLYQSVYSLTMTTFLGEVNRQIEADNAEA